MFFSEIDVLNLERARYFILGRKPRKLLKPDMLKEPGFSLQNLVNLAKVVQEEAGLQV